ELRREFLRGVAAGGDPGDVNAGGVEGREVLDHMVLAAELDRAAGRARGGQRYELADREIAFGQDRQHHFADGAGGADDGYVETTGVRGVHEGSGKGNAKGNGVRRAAHGRCLRGNPRTERPGDGSPIVSRALFRRSAWAGCRPAAPVPARRPGCPRPGWPSRGGSPGWRCRRAASTPRCAAPAAWG